MALTMTSHSRLAFLAFAAGVCSAHGHGRLAVPMARNGGDNGAVGGGPGAVHAFDASDAHAMYKHGICGNAAGGPQAYNKVGEVQETYVAGSTAEFKVVITAHHVGYFEFELCADAGSLSEACFMEHRLLKEGCECSCPGDSTNSCSECDECRRWWKPLLEGELHQSVTSGYEGPKLPGQGNLVPYEYTLRYVIPSGLQTSRAVLRWHYMTTNSCTSKTSAPEEFWNCADIAVSDASGDVGPELPYSNSDLEQLAVEDLIPKIKSGELQGVNAVCPEDSAGDLLGVGSASEYADSCGASVDGAYERCVDLSSGGGSVADCSDPPSSGIMCESQCSDAWFQCHNGVAYTQYVPVGTKCKDDNFVLAAECEGHEATEPEQEPTASPAPSAAPTSQPSTSEPTQAPTQTSTPAQQTSPAPASTSVPAGPTGNCGDCAGCLWGSGVCYGDVDAAYCGSWPDNHWCGGSSLVQNRAGLRGAAATSSASR